MKQNTWLRIGCGILLLFTVTQAQLKSQIREAPTVEQSIRVPGLSSALGSLSLFDPSRFSMSQSYSLSFMSGAGRTASLGMYQNSMTYLFSDKLLLNARLGFIHDPLQRGSLASTSLLDNLVYGADLLYHPNKNLWLNLSFDRAPMVNRYYPYYSRFYSE